MPSGEEFFDKGLLNTTRRGVRQEMGVRNLKRSLNTCRRMVCSPTWEEGSSDSRFGVGRARPPTYKCRLGCGAERYAYMHGGDYRE